MSTDLILIGAVRLKKKYEEDLRVYLESRKPEIEATFFGRMVSGRGYAFIVDGVEVRDGDYLLKGRSVRISDGVLYKRASFDSMTYRSFKSRRENIKWFEKINECKFVEV